MKQRKTKTEQAYCNGYEAGKVAMQLAIGLVSYMQSSNLSTMQMARLMGISEEHLMGVIACEKSPKMDELATWSVRLEWDILSIDPRPLSAKYKQKYEDFIKRYQPAKAQP